VANVQNAGWKNMGCMIGRRFRDGRCSSLIDETPTGF